MGWREWLRNFVVAWHGVNPSVKTADLATAVLAMPAADRIALARELLAGVGYHAVVIPDEWDIQGEFGEGWNACRAAMMADDSATDKHSNDVVHRDA